VSIRWGALNSAKEIFNTGKGAQGKGDFSQEKKVKTSLSPGRKGTLPRQEGVERLGGREKTRMGGEEQMDTFI